MAFRDQAAVLDQAPTLVGMVGQHLASPPDEPGRGLVAGGGEQVDVAQQLVTRQPAACALRVLELRLEQLGHQIIGGMLHPPVDVLRERLALVASRCLEIHVGHGAILEPQALVDAVPEHLLVLLRDAKEHADSSASASARRGRG